MHFTFVEAVDFLLKAHKLFNLEYNPKIKVFMNFIECYVYRMTAARRSVPQRLRSIGKQVQELAAETEQFPTAEWMAIYQSYVVIYSSFKLNPKKVNEPESVMSVQFL